MESPERIKQSADLEKIGLHLVRPETLAFFGPFVGNPETVKRLGGLLAGRTICPMLVAEPGVGKTTTVRWLAALMASVRAASAGERDDHEEQEDQSPGSESGPLTAADPELARIAQSVDFRDIVELGALDLARDCYYTYNLENKLDLLIKACRRRNTVLFLDDCHLCATSGASGADPSSTVASLLAPALSRFSVRTIGATTPAGWLHIQRRNPQFARLFTALPLEPMTLEETRRVLDVVALGERERGGPVVPGWILEELVDMAVTLLPGRQLPGSAVEILRELIAGVATQHDPERSVTSGDLVSVLTLRSGFQPIVVDRRLPLAQSDIVRALKKDFFGQDAAVAVLAEHVSRFKARLQAPDRPAGVLLFVGPSGVGKTELARRLARLLFQSDRHLIRLDMSEFRTADSLERIIGSTGVELRPPSLVEQVRSLTSAVLLLDEVEKAHPIVWNLFLQAFSDGGRMTGADGTSATFRNCFIVMTSNAGSDLYQRSHIGFDSFPGDQKLGVAAIRQRLETVFSAEFLGRVSVVHFRPLGTDSLRRIAQLEIGKLTARLGQHGIWRLDADADVIDLLLREGTDARLGARPLQRAVERLVGTVVADLVNAGRLADGTVVRLRIAAGGVRAEVEGPDGSRALALPEAVQ